MIEISLINQIPANLHHGLFFGHGPPEGLRHHVPDEGAHYLHDHHHQGGKIFVGALLTHNLHMLQRKNSRG